MLIFKDKTCIVIDPVGIVLFTVNMRNKCFPLNWMKVRHTAYKCISVDTDLWHRRFDHVNHGFLSQMFVHNLVIGFPKIIKVDKVCNSCLFGKQSRVPFPKTRKWKATHKLELVHTDIGGPMKTLSLNGSKFYMMFIDDMTRFSWIYFLKMKSETLNVFTKFKAFAENQTNSSIKVLMSDKGTKYTTNEFEKYLAQLGIVHWLIVIYSPQQNRTFKRKNKSVMEMTRCLLFEMNSPKTLWAEVANTANYLLNLA